MKGGLKRFVVAKVDSCDADRVPFAHDDITSARHLVKRLLELHSSNHHFRRTHNTEVITSRTRYHYHDIC